MTVAVIIPFKGGCRYRERNFEYVRNHYRRHRWPVVVCEPVNEWRKGEAVGFGVRSTTADVLVIADADSFVAHDVLDEAVAQVVDGRPWVTPHHYVYRLTDAETVRVIEGHAPNLSKRNLDYPVLPGVFGGGITVVTRDAYNTAPINTRFAGWGGEDVAFGWSLATLVAHPHRLDGDLIHLWHPSAAETNVPGRRTGSAEVEALKDLYVQARGVPRLMRALVAQTDPEPDTPLEQPVTFRSATRNRVVRVGTKVARFCNGTFTTSDPDLAEALPMHANVEEVP